MNESLFCNKSKWLRIVQLVKVLILKKNQNRIYFNFCVSFVDAVTKVKREKYIFRDIYLSFVVHYLAIPREFFSPHCLFSQLSSPRLCFALQFCFSFADGPREMREVFDKKKKKKCREASEYTGNLTYNSRCKNRQAHAPSIYNVSIIYALPLVVPRATNG